MGFIIHLELKSGEHYFFGSIAAIYTRFTAKEIGVAASTLYHYGLSDNNAYTNKACTISKAEVIRKANGSN